MSKSTIDIVCTTDANYMQHCGAMLNSLLSNTPDREFRIFIIHSDTVGKEKGKLEKALRHSNISTQFIQVDDSILDGAPVSHHVNLSTYYRILIPRLLDGTIEKVLFLDADIIIRKSISELWNLDISDFSHGAAQDFNVKASHLSSLGLQKGSHYFNAGVLLINLKTWRELDLSQKAISFIAECPERIVFWDQDALNYVLQGKWLRLEPKWNATRKIFEVEDPMQIGMNKDEFDTAKSDPAIVHFTGGGPSKPWHYFCIHPFKYEYDRFVAQTPWKNYTPIAQPSLISRTGTHLKNYAKQFFA